MRSIRRVHTERWDNHTVFISKTQVFSSFEAQRMHTLNVASVDKVILRVLRGSTDGSFIRRIPCNQMRMNHKSESNAKNRQQPSEIGGNAMGTPLRWTFWGRHASLAQCFSYEYLFESLAGPTFTRMFQKKLVICEKCEVSSEKVALKLIHGIYVHPNAGKQYVCSLKFPCVLRNFFNKYKPGVPQNSRIAQMKTRR